MMKSHTPMVTSKCLPPQQTLSLDSSLSATFAGINLGNPKETSLDETNGMPGDVMHPPALQ